MEGERGREMEGEGERERETETHIKGVLFSEQN